MKYRHLLEELFGNQTRIAATRVLVRFPEKTWTIRQLAAFVEKSHFAVAENLVALEAMGVATLGRHGKAQMVQLNREGWVYNKVLKRAFQAESRAPYDLIDDLKGLLAGEPVIFAAIFGSIATGTERLGSDIDLLIITEDAKTVGVHLAEKRGIISRRYGNEISPYFLTLSEFKKKQNTSLVQGIRAAHIPLRGEWP